MIQLDELKARKRVLRRLGYATDADVIETKGRVACEVSTADEVEKLLKMISSNFYVASSHGDDFQRNFQHNDCGAVHLGTFMLDLPRKG